VRRDVGQALYTAQRGETDPAARPLRGFGGTRVMEIVDHHDTNTCRAVYTARFKEAVYVLHAFQKKSKRGIACDKPVETDLPQGIERIGLGSDGRRRARGSVGQNSRCTGSGICGPIEAVR